MRFIFVETGLTKEVYIFSLLSQSPLRSFVSTPKKKHRTRVMGVY